jgi:hypothetical protein
MNIIECEQGTPEWHAARCGRVTASRVADIMRETKSGISKTRQTYLGELVAERLSGVQQPGHWVSGPMQRGKDTEAAAAARYEFVNGVETKTVGFVVHPTIDLSGTSPDLLVGDDGIVEIKCPNTATHIDTLFGGKPNKDYITQVHWTLACTDRQWGDLVSFDDRLPLEMQMVPFRVQRDAMLIAKMEAAVKEFLRDVDATVARLKRQFGVSE